MFRGSNSQEHVRLIIEFLGKPSKSAIAHTCGEAAAKEIASFPALEKASFEHTFPGTSPDALDLLSKMLMFDPAARISVNVSGRPRARR